MSAIVGDIAEPAKHLTRLPRELYAEIQKAAAKEGVSVNAYVVAILAGAHGYKLPKK